MDFKNLLIESKNGSKNGSWKNVVMSTGLHGLILGGAIVISMTATDKVAAEEKPIPVYIAQGAAPPPPPPPPPPPAASASSSPRRTTPKVEVKPVVIPKDTFVAPTRVPDKVPEANEPVVSDSIEEVTEDTSAPVGGVVGGVTGGVVGGQLGGETGGVLGGQVGGVIGGVVGGTVGGTGTTLGGTGTGTQPAPAPVPVAAPAGPLRVGGDVKAPTAYRRSDPQYTEVARRARISGVVIVEAVIDKQGNVDQVKVIRGLPMGLSESAAAAVRQWKFKPGTRGGQPVDVIFNLTVVFQLGNDGPSVTRSSSRPVASPAPKAAPKVEAAPEPLPQPEPAPQPAAVEPTESATPVPEPLPTPPPVD